MSRPFFWIVFLAALFTSVFLALSLPHDAVPMLLVALVWIGTAALAWQKWVSPDVTGFKRVAAGVGAALVVFSVYEWLPRDDVFVIDSKCDNRPGTFWPLIFMWLLGAGLSAYALLGNIPTLRDVVRPHLRSIALWLAALAWTLMCAYVLVNNITMDVFIESMRLAGYVVGGIALFFGGIFALGWLFTFPQRRRMKQAVADYESLDEASRQGMIDLIDSHSRQDEFILMYRPVEQAGSSAATARIGGDPVALPDETWPTNGDGSPGIFLLQLPLLAPRFPPQWQGRIVVVFLVEYSLLVRSYSASAISQLTALHNPQDETVVAKQELQELAIPYVPNPQGEEDEDEDDEWGGFDTAQLLARIPELQARLGQVTKYPVYVLNQVIEGEAQLAAEDAILVGGDPQLIQGEHDPLCPVCRQPMRFLFQFGDVTEEFLLGDCGVGYIYGCDAHPEQCEGFVDCF